MRGQRLSCHSPPPPSSSSGPDPRIHSVMYHNGMAGRWITAWILGSEAEDDENRVICAKTPPLFPHPPPPCHTDAAPAAGWIANASSQAGGRPLEVRRNVRQASGGGRNQRGSAGGFGRPRGRHGPASHRDDLAIRSRLMHVAFKWVHLNDTAQASSQRAEGRVGQRPGPVAKFCPVLPARVRVFHRNDTGQAAQGWGEAPCRRPRNKLPQCSLVGEAARGNPENPA